MKPPRWTPEERLAALRRCAIIDTPAEAAFDDAAALIRAICRTPIALVSMIDAERQWFKARIGIDAPEWPIDSAICALTIQQDDVLVIEDLAADPRTAHLPLVIDAPRLRFYAGIPLVTAQGLPLGTLCAIDVAPRPGGLDLDQRAGLRALARQLASRIEQRSARAEQNRDSAVLESLLVAQQRVLLAGGDFISGLQALVDAALDAVGPADGVVVQMRDGDDMVYRAGSGIAADRVGLRIPISTSFSGRALIDESTLVIVDAREDDHADIALAEKLGIRSLVAVPLSRHGTVFGVLLLHSDRPNAFQSRDILIGQMLAGLVAGSFSESAEMEALRSVEATERHYRHIVDSEIDRAIISTDSDGVITSWSKGAETLTGWCQADALGRAIDILFTPEDIAVGRITDQLARATREGHAWDERWHVRHDGSRFYGSGTITPLLGPGAGFVLSLRDVTGEHATRTAFETSRIRLNAALDTGLIGFFSWDIPSATVTGDARFAEFYGLDRDMVERGVPLGAVLANVLAEDRDRLDGQLDGSRAGSADYVRQYRTRDRDGGIRWLLVRGRCIEQVDNVPRVYVGTAIDVTMQREAEEHLRLSRERAELAMHAAQLGAFDYRPYEGVLDWDDRCRALFGLSPETPVNFETGFLAGLHPDDRATANQVVAAALDPAGSGTFDAEWRTIGIEDGIERVLLSKGLAIFAGGVPVRLIGTVQDITADRLARATLTETEQRFRFAVRATNDAIWDWDLTRDDVLWNEALSQSYGHPPETVASTGAWWIAHIHPDDRARVTHSIHAVIDGIDTDWSEDYRFERADGRYADVRDRGYVIRDGDGRALRMIGAMHDQSDRKQIERDLQQLNRSLVTSVTAREDELNRLWRTSPDLLVVLNFAGIIQRVNPAWTAILGFAPEELIGRAIDTLVIPDDIDLTRAALTSATLGPLPTVENRYYHKDGSIRWFAWVAAPMGSEIYATGRHITADKEAQIALRNTEDQLRQAQKVEAIGQLTGGVAHDFNNLLTVIRGSVDLLRHPQLSEERRKRYTDAIADTAERAAKLTSQLLAFARRSALTPETFDVGHSIRALGGMMTTLAGSMITLEVDVAPENCFVHADPSQFDTALINMVANARDAMHNQGTLQIRIAAVDTMPPIRNAPRVAGRFVAISVIDAGVGIPADQIDHIFEPFFTTKQVGEGTGLGLSQVFGFAKQSGGEIQVQSTEGEGTVFTLYLPRVMPGAADARRVGTMPALRSEGANILVVEDNVDVGAFAMQALVELGYHAVRAEDGARALEILAEGTTRFDVVFSDVVMPGISGIELGQQIRQLYPDMPVLLCSGFSSVLAQEGAHGFALLHKPYSVAELSEALRRVSCPPMDGGDDNDAQTPPHDAAVA